MFWKSSICFLSLFGLVLAVSPDWIQKLKDDYELAQTKTEFVGLKQLAEKFIGANKTEKVANVNDYIDELVVNLNKYIVTSGVNPYALPSFEESFQWTIFFGWVSLTEGSLNGLNTVERKGDALIKYNYPNVQVHAVLGFTKLEIQYHYEAKFMGLGPEGSAVGKAIDSSFLVEMELHMVNLRANLGSFQINTVGDVSLKFQGESIIHDFANILISVVLPIMKPILSSTLTDIISTGLSVLIQTFNNAVCGILGNCPPVNVM